MTYNPDRQKNGGRKVRPRRAAPGTGIKHSDIMKRQGIGQSVPLAGRVTAPFGFLAPIFVGDKFTVKSLYINAGNALGYGVNKKQERIYTVKRGILYIVVEDNGSRQVQTLQQDSTFRATKGLAHSIASGNSDVEVIVTEETDYDKNWTIIGDEAVVTAAVVDNSKQEPTIVSPPRRRDSSKARAYQEQQARKSSRRGAPGKAANQGKVGRNKQVAANSPAVAGVSPMPAGAGAFSDE